MSAPFPQFNKAPSDVILYGVNFTNWLGEGDSIASVVWNLDRGIVKQNPTETDTVALVTISGGVLGRSYTVTCTATMTLGSPVQTKSQSFQINVQQT